MWLRETSTHCSSVSFTFGKSFFHHTLPISQHKADNCFSSLCHLHRVKCIDIQSTGVDNWFGPTIFSVSLCILTKLHFDQHNLGKRLICTSSELWADGSIWSLQAELPCALCFERAPLQAASLAHREPPWLRVPGSTTHTVNWSMYPNAWQFCLCFRYFNFLYLTPLPPVLNFSEVSAEHSHNLLKLGPFSCEPLWRLRGKQGPWLGQ